MPPSSTQLRQRDRRGRASKAAPHTGLGDPLTNAVLTVPVFLTYHLGILLIEYRNGVDLVTGLTFRLLESSVVGYVLVTVSIAVALSFVAARQQRRRRVRATALGPVLVESGAWAAVMLVTVGWMTAQLQAALALAVAPPLGPLAPAMGPVDKLVMAAGAGFHEEVVFRVALLSGGRELLMRLWRMAPAPALVLSLLASSLLFALAHHVGAGADPIEMSAFLFRGLAGLFLAGVYLLRGFAVVVYTHALYDVLVFFFF